MGLIEETMKKYRQPKEPQVQVEYNKGTDGKSISYKQIFTKKTEDVEYAYYDAACTVPFKAFGDLVAACFINGIALVQQNGVDGRFAVIGVKDDAILYVDDEATVHEVHFLAE